MRLEAHIHACEFHPDLHTCMYVQVRPIGLPTLALGQGTSARPVITRCLEGARWIHASLLKLPGPTPITAPHPMP